MILWYHKIDFVISQNRYHETVKWYRKFGFVILQTPYDFYIKKLRDNIVISQILSNVSHLPITSMRNRDQYRMSIRGASGLALEESKMHTFSRI